MSAEPAQGVASPVCQPDHTSRVENQDKCSDSLTNEDIKHRILNVYAKFVSDVHPERLCDWLLQESVISLERSREIHSENRTQQQKCRALLDFLFSTQHPNAFFAVLKALSDQNHYLFESINNQESRSGIRDSQTVLLDNSEKSVDIEKKYEKERKTWSDEKEQLMKQREELLAIKQQYEQKNEALSEAKEQQMKQIQELKAVEQKYEQERKACSEEKEQLMKRLMAVEQKYEEEEKVWSKDRKVWSDEKEKLLKDIQKLHRDTLLYKPEPALLQTIRTKAAETGRKAIRGFTILEREMFVVSWDSSKVEVYDSKTCNFSRQWDLKELISAVDMRSCSRNKCLYIFDHKGRDQSKEILRTDSNGKLIRSWSTGDDYGHGLSVTDEANVLLTVYEKNKLNEYSPDGQLIREIRLSSDAGISHPRHAIRLTNGHFVVSHGYDDNDLHRVCIVDAEGKLKKAFGGKSGSSMELMSYPIYLAVDGNGFVMVADRGNQRVLLLDSELKFMKEILSKERHGLKRVWSILLAESNNRLFVTDNEFDPAKKIFRDGRIFIFNCK